MEYPNDYAEAITGIGSIIQDYDDDHRFMAIGFGAKLEDGVVHHDFAINKNPEDPYCDGIVGVLEAYYKSFDFAALWGACAIVFCALLTGRARSTRYYFVQAQLVLRRSLTVCAPWRAKAPTATTTKFCSF